MPTLDQSSSNFQADLANSPPPRYRMAPAPLSGPSNAHTYKGTVIVISKTLAPVMLFVALAFGSGCHTVNHYRQQMKVYRHVVAFKFKATATPEQINEIVDEFGKLPAQIDTIIGYEWGPQVSPEPLHEGTTHVFLVTFKDRAGLDVYLPHPAHQAFVAKLKPILEKAVVVDYDARD